MPNTSCFSGPAFSITGNTSFLTKEVDFVLQFDSAQDQASVKAVQWYLDGILLIAEQLTEFHQQVPCGTHTIGARILTGTSWSGVKTQSFRTCYNPTAGVGVLVVDFNFVDTLNVIGLVDNPEVIHNHEAAYTGNNTVPFGASPASALVLSSDYINQATLKWRLEFNIAKLTTDYPGIAQFVFLIKGRAQSAGTLSGAYSLKVFTAQMTLNNSAGTYIPSVVGATIGTVNSFSAPLASGANGSFLETDLPLLVKFTYNVNTQTLSWSNS